ncbi:MAG TPA: SMI1/KNR4 family protein [Tepidisphaeraceae bacterium]|jgi:hypothetical protein|nr:SMI1/KNR4 family protein [Tepidisphaeraceae bacterium]
MDSTYDRLKAALPGAVFYPPADKEQIATVEKELESQFPDWLRELYLSCNGIQSKDHGDPYLYPLQKSESLANGLLEWNQFFRGQWEENLPLLRQYRAEIEWDGLEPHRLIIIGESSGITWAIKIDGAPEIISYDVRNPEARDIIADDLVSVCTTNEEERQEISECLFRGRELYRGQDGLPPPTRDIDYLFDLIVQIHKPRDLTPGVRFSSGWYLDRATSQRPGESGELFIISIGPPNEVSLASRDGNFPMIMRLKACRMETAPTCIVWSLRDAIMLILGMQDALSKPFVDGQQPPSPDESEIRRIWRDHGHSDPELAAIADVLFERDDKRRQEENQLG